LGDNVTVAEVKEVGAGEVWVRLDKDHAEKFSLGAADGEVWSLAVTATDTHYLESEAEIQEQRWPELPIPPSSSVGQNFQFLRQLVLTQWQAVRSFPLAPPRQAEGQMFGLRDLDLQPPTLPHHSPRQTPRCQHFPRVIQTRSHCQDAKAFRDRYGQAHRQDR